MYQTVDGNVGIWVEEICPCVDEGSINAMYLYTCDMVLHSSQMGIRL